MGVGKFSIDTGIALLIIFVGEGEVNGLVRVVKHA